MEFDGTFIVIVISFVVFMVLMRSIYFEPIRQIKDVREQKKADDKKDTQTHLADLEKVKAEYEQGLKDARKRSHQVLQEIRQEAKQSAAETLSNARTKATQELDAQMAELSAWREETYQKLAEDRKALAHHIVEKVTGKVPAVSKG